MLMWTLLGVLPQRHRRLLATLAAGVLAGSAVTAFGIAPLAPDAAALPRRIVVGDLPGPDLAPQLDALARHELALRGSGLTRATDTADSLLERLGAHDPQAARFLRADAVARQLLEGRSGKMVQVRLDRHGALRELVARYPVTGGEQADSHFNRLRVEATDSGWRATRDVVPLTTSTRLASGTIRSSLFAATDEAGLPDSIAVQIAELLSGDIDFHRELRRGDTFSVVYESLVADDEPVAWGSGTGRVLAVEFINAGRAHSAVWYHGAQGKGGYFDLSGRSKHRAFLSSPMAFSRVTSGFSMRMHPILQTWRRHLGVDYAAPAGTPVRSVGDGTVVYAGWQSGYGKVVKIDHGSHRETIYAHLSRVDVQRGKRVEQGQRIGAVGATGWATGPHLHFEFRVDGTHQNPTRIAPAVQTQTLDPPDAREFAALAPGVRAQLDAARSLAGSRTE